MNGSAPSLHARRVLEGRRFVTCAVASASDGSRTPRTPRTDVVAFFAALQFATARPLRALGVVQRMALRSSARVPPHILFRLLGSVDPVARPVFGQDPRSPASWSDRCASRTTGGIV